MSDRAARAMAALALALAVLSLGVSGVLWSESQRYVEEARQLREALDALSRPGLPLPMRGPPPALEFDDE